MVDIRQKGMQIGMAILVGAVLIAVLMPTAIGAFYEEDSETIIQEENESYEFKFVNSTVTEVDDTDNEVSFDFEELGGDATDSSTISEDETYTLDLDGKEGDITVNEINSSTDANVTYEAERTAGMDGIVKSLFMLIPLFLVLMAVMYAVKMT